jgi:histidinol-phosphate aminotransferase
MSKAFAFAGVRVGYLAADKAVIDAIQLVRLPYHLSSLTQAAAEVALDFQDELLAEVAKLSSDRDQLANALVQMGLQVIPSNANFILFSGFKQSSHDLWQKLLAQGVLIRDVGLPGYLRVTIGNEAENQQFLNALKGAL